MPCVRRHPKKKLISSASSAYSAHAHAHKPKIKNGHKFTIRKNGEENQNKKKNGAHLHTIHIRWIHNNNNNTESAASRKKARNR